MKTIEIMLTMIVSQLAESSTVDEFTVYAKNSKFAHEGELYDDSGKLIDDAEITEAYNNWFNFYSNKLNPIKEFLNDSENIKQLYKNKGLVSKHFCIDDIIHKAKEKGHELTEKQTTDIINLLENIDCNVGINWETISIMIDEVLES